ncbi:hypothetical protein H477_4889 [[Clostridium] sordellii ATCC 9714]|nr:hypothetical protein H477_4889 [[Clostridium] sordellii ATCC 9714] [Paeniclostridium sordellii ATCC 9714]
MIEMMIEGIKSMNFSSEFFLEDDEEKLLLIDLLIKFLKTKLVML